MRDQDVEVIIIIIIIIIVVVAVVVVVKTYIWDPLNTKWFFSLQLKSKNENAKSIYLLFTKKTIKQNNKKQYH